ncbi:MAG: SMP-30/gluconolactonase/LRE family protein [Draconibacterium sp.]|nr:SMP-30/gluconolactonase/LRE family protein [Draconibacterium sp.]
MRALIITLFLTVGISLNLFSQTIGTTEAGFVDGENPRLNKPIRMAVYKDGAVLFVDFNNNAIRTVNKKGVVTTLFGAPEKKGYRDGNIDKALFTGMHGVAYDKENDIIYTVSASNNVIRKITNKDGNLFAETIAGNQDKKGFVDGPASSAEFNSLHQILLGQNGEIYVLDIGNAKVRMLKNGVVSTIAGNDSLSPIRADFKYPIDMSFDGEDIVICDAGNFNIYRLKLNSEIIKMELDTKLKMPHGITSNNNGTLFIADMGANKIVKIESDKNVTVIEDKNLNKPATVLLENGTLWIGDLYNHQVKYIELE